MHNSPNNIIQELNLSIFKTINHLFGKDKLDLIMIVIDALGEAKKMYYHFSIIIVIALYMLFYCRKNQEEFKKAFISTSSCIITFCSSMLSLVIALILKNYTEMHRPFCSLTDLHTIKYITDNLNCNHSFPSGHIIFTTILSVSLWPILNKGLKLFSILFIILTAITRIASGAHYPIDLLGGLAISLPLSLYAKSKSYSFVIWIENKYKLSSFIKNKLTNNT